MARSGTTVALALLLLAAALLLLDRCSGEPAVVPDAPPGEAAAASPQRTEPRRDPGAPAEAERTPAAPAATSRAFVVQGVVLADPLAPDLEGLRVLAYQGHPADRSGLLSATKRARGAATSSIALRGDPVAECPVDRHGRFELRAPTPHLRVAVDHDLYLLPTPEIVHVDEADGAHRLVLSPLLGGLLRGRLLGAEAAAIDEVALAQMPDPMAVIRDPRLVLAATAGATRPTARPAGDGTFSFRAVAPGARLQLSARGRDVAGRRSEPPLCAGEVRDVVVPVATAARLVVEVVDAEGAPLADAAVAVQPKAAGPAGVARAERGQTDARGRCAFGGLASGSYEVEATMRGRAPARRDLELVAAATASRVHLTLREGGVVTGVVRGPDGAPVEGASVAHHPASDVPLLGDLTGQLGPDYLRQVSQQGATTDDDGRFRLAGILDEGRFLVVGSHPDLGAAIASGVRVGDEDVEVELPKLGAISGRVFEAGSGAPIPRFTVSVTRRAFLVVEMPVTTAYVDDADGAFSVAGVAAGTYTLQIDAGARGRHAQQVTVIEGDDVEGIEVLIPRAASIRGVVRDEDGAPVANANVRRRRGAMADNPLLSMFTSSEARTFSDAEGRFELTPVEPGSLRLIATARGFATGQSQRVTVDAGALRDEVVIELGRGGSIEGRLRCSAQQRPGDFLLIAKEQVSQNSATADVAPGGRFRFEALDPGSYEVQAMPADLMRDLNEPRWRPGEGMKLGELMRAVTDSVVSQRCRVRAGEATAVELDVRDLTLGAEWRIEVDVAGEPVTAGVVEVTSVETGAVRIAILESGAATFGRVQPGRYRMQTRAGLTMTPVGAPQQLRFPSGTDAHTSTVSLPGGRLSGRAVDEASGAPLAGALVRLHHDGHRERDDALGACLTDDEGSFAFSGLPDGTYSLRAGGGFGSSRLSTSRVEGIEVQNGTATNPVELRARPAAGATVQVTAPGGAPVRGATAVCVDVQGRPLGPGNVAVTGADGTASFGGLADGSVRIVARAPGLAPGFSAAQQVTAGAAARFDLQLRSGARTRLSIVDANGERLRGATLTARVDEGPWLPPMMLVLGVSADGALDLGALGPGRWTFRVQHPAVGTLSTTREIAGTRPVTVVLSGG